LLKLLALSGVVLCCSIVATAWLSVHVTAVALKQQQGQTLNDDTTIYNTLLGYAATHPSWTDAGSTVQQLARQTDQRIMLTTPSRRPLLAVNAANGAARATLPVRPFSTIDPLAVDTTLAEKSQIDSVSPSTPGPACVPHARVQCVVSAQTSSETSTDRIDRRAVGPFLLTNAERRRLDSAAHASATCMESRFHVTADVVSSPSGRPSVETTSPVSLPQPNACDSALLSEPTPSETKALDQLDQLVNACLASRNQAPVKVLLGFAWEPNQDGAADNQGLVSSCITSRRTELLTPYVAPPALLFVSSPDQPASTFLDLSASNRRRIIEVVALVMLVTMLITALAAMRIIQPLHAVAGAAQRMSSGDLSSRVTVTSRDEIGNLAAAFNAMSDHREQLDRSRKEMTSDIAHELRTPLSNIRGWLEAAEDGITAADLELVSSLLEETLLLEQVIDDLSDLAAADAGELKLRLEPIDARDLLDQVSAAHRMTADTVGVTLRVDGVDRAALTGDAVRLRQALGNLVGNAIRHTPVGGSVTLEVWLEGDQVVIGVRDTGTGIRVEDFPLLFDRFWRSDKSRSRRTGGSGLGLAIVRKFVEAHHGTVTATNNDTGPGALFTLRLPVSEPPSQ
jgi:two-component system sensor histidine kinase BaeS